MRAPPPLRPLPPRRGQTSVEFLLLIGFMTVVLLSFLAVVNARTRDVARQTTLTDLEEVSHLITSELAYTIRFEDGYQRTFQLPHTLDGLAYAAQIRGQKDLVIETGELQHVAFLESPVVGQLRRGPNTLTKGNGGQLFLNVDTALPQIEIDGNESDWAIRFVSSLNENAATEVDDQVAADCGGAGNCDSANTAAAPNHNELTDFFATHDEDTLSFKVKYAPGSLGNNFLAANTDLNTAIFIDATIVRLVLVPSVMQLMGRANWWFPRWLDRIVPNISAAGGETTKQGEQVPF